MIHHQSSMLPRLRSCFRLGYGPKLSASSSFRNENPRYASTLIIADPFTPIATTTSTITERTVLAPQTLSVVKAAEALHDGPITVLTFDDVDVDSNNNTTEDDDVSPYLPSSISRLIRISNTNDDNTVVCSDHKRRISSPLLAEDVSIIALAALKNQQEDDNCESYSHVVATSNKFGSDFVPRLSAMLNVSPVTDVIEVLGDDLFVRPMYAGNALVKVKMGDSNEDGVSGIDNGDTPSPKIITVRPSAFDRSLPRGNVDHDQNSASVKIINLNVDFPSESLSIHLSTNDSSAAGAAAAPRPDLGSATAVVAGGRGLGSSEQFVSLTNELADAIGDGCAVGASRAAVDAGYAPNDLQVGQTGKAVAPDLYVAVSVFLGAVYILIFWVIFVY